jgi:hypothetical protein
MPPVVFKQIAELVLVYERPEELVRKPTHRRLVEVTKSHILTVSSDKVVHKRTSKKVARNLNTASLTNLFLVCRQFRDVGMKVYYRKNVFKFSTERNLSAWAKAIGSRCRFVRSIQLNSHWEVGFKDDNFQPQTLHMRYDSGLVYTMSLRGFPNLEEVHLAIGCSSQWQHNAFKRYHPDFGPAMENKCWAFAVQCSNDMTDVLRDNELQSNKINTRHTLIFDGSFVVGQSNQRDHHERMKDFVRRIRAMDTEIPKGPAAVEGLSPVLLGPLLPNTAAVPARAPTGAWGQRYVDDKSISTGCTTTGVVHVHDICTKRAAWAAVMFELLAKSSR